MKYCFNKATSICHVRNNRLFQKYVVSILYRNSFFLGLQISKRKWHNSDTIRTQFLYFFTKPYWEIQRDCFKNRLLVWGSVVVQGSDEALWCYQSDHFSGYIFGPMLFENTIKFLQVAGRKENICQNLRIFHGPVMVTLQITFTSNTYHSDEFNFRRSLDVPMCCS